MKIEVGFTHGSVEQTLREALGSNLAEVLVIGRDEDGEVAVIRSSRMNHTRALWLMDAGKQWIKDVERAKTS